MSETYCRVLVYEPNQPGKLVELKDTLKGLQEAVGGYIEIIQDADTGARIVVNEEGQLRRLPRNRMMGGHTIVGTAVVTMVDEHGKFSGLSDDDVQRVRKAYG